MTKTSGRRIKCMTCGGSYRGGKGDHVTCPYCAGIKPLPKREAAPRKPIARRK